METNQTFRTHTISVVTEQLVGHTVVLAGWVDRQRDHGDLVFIDLRDRYGVIQVVFNLDASQQVLELARSLRAEDVISVKGILKSRIPETINPKLKTGTIELIGEKVSVLNRSKALPFPIRDNIQVSEEHRLTYRYLDLRRPIMQQRIALRHQVVKFIRDWLDKQNFLEIETPILIKSTPEGARDFLVPSRLHPGKFYALPQSPQQLKQLLMVAGMDRYFQIARCFRDEDLRGDRQPEFTQLDIEMAFVTQEDVIVLNEALMVELIRATAPHMRLLERPFPHLTYDEAVSRYGSDKPDLRFGMELIDLNPIWAISDFRVFRNLVEKDKKIKGICVPGLAELTRREMQEIEERAKALGAEGLAWIQVQSPELLRGSVPQIVANEVVNKKLLEACSAKPGNAILMIGGDPHLVHYVLGNLRLEMGERLGLRDPNILGFAWIKDFPLLEWNSDEQRWVAVHHPFTAPMPEDLHLLDADPGLVRAWAYDLVANGWEVAGGSIRIFQRSVQSKIFGLLKIHEADAEKRFGHLLEAFEYGAPPHGGIAWGLDRLIMVITGTPNIREVIAFPKNGRGSDQMMDAPSLVDQEQLDVLHIQIDPLNFE